VKVLVEAKVLLGWGCRLSEGVSGGEVPMLNVVWLL
jgi:hypothetical protein